MQNLQDISHGFMTAHHCSSLQIWVQLGSTCGVQKVVVATWCACRLLSPALRGGRMALEVDELCSALARRARGLAAPAAPAAPAAAKKEKAEKKEEKVRLSKISQKHPAQ